MYIRPAHAELGLETLHAFIQHNALGVFTTHLEHPTIAPLQSTHIPFVIDPPAEGFAASVDDKGRPVSGRPLGKLRGHMARANPHARALLSAAAAAATTPGTTPASTSTGAASYLPSFLRSAPSPTSGSSDDSRPRPDGTGGALPRTSEALIIFQSPAHSYTTPKFYTSTKPATGAVVPTWDYAAVQVYGTVTVYDRDARAGAFLQKQVEDLSAQQERMHAERKARVTGCPLEGVWKVADAPVEYVEGLKKGIIGFEVEITRVEGRFKLSQENEDGDWQGVVDGFKGLGEEGERLAEMIESRGQDREVVKARTA